MIPFLNAESKKQARAGNYMRPAGDPSSNRHFRRFFHIADGHLDIRKDPFIQMQGRILQAGAGNEICP